MDFLFLGSFVSLGPVDILFPLFPRQWRTCSESEL